MDTVLEIIKYTFPSLIVFFASYYTLKSLLKTENSKAQFEYKLEKQRVTLPIRLQAYERMTLLLERLTLANLINRVRTPNMSARTLQIALLQNIRMEFDHNVAQQIYVSAEAWMHIIAAKEQTLSIINRISASLPPQANSIDFSKRLLQYFGENEEPIPTDKPLQFLKEEVTKIF